MYMPPNTRLRLDPKDEYTHPPEPVSNYNESMYFNVFDSPKRLGAWMRIGNRPNEGYCEMTCCVYLPDGRVGFMFARPACMDNTELAAAGMRIEVLEPFKKMRVTYDGELLVMDDPRAMSNPSSAFKKYPKRPASMVLNFEGISPMHGGEIVDMDGHPIKLDTEYAVYRGHTEQHMLVQGYISVDGQRFDIRDGTGYRDKSWGPRNWSSFYWYKWLPVAFSPNFGVLLSIKGRPEGGSNRVSGNVLRNGLYEPVLEGRIDTEYDENWYPIQLNAWMKTEQREYMLRGRVLTTVPLRHRAKHTNDNDSYTRITESLTEYECDGNTALGMTEFCDLMLNHMPVSISSQQLA